VRSSPYHAGNGFLSSCAEREALAIRAPNTQR
jgi:hypothetical protein